MATYEWGLGCLSNNRAEAYAMLKGLEIIKTLKMEKVMIFGDSTIIISMMNNFMQNPNIALSRFIDRCCTLCKET